MFSSPHRRSLCIYFLLFDLYPWSYPLIPILFGLLHHGSRISLGKVSHHSIRLDLVITFIPLNSNVFVFSITINDDPTSDHHNNLISIPTFLGSCHWEALEYPPSIDSSGGIKLLWFGLTFFNSYDFSSSSTTRSQLNTATWRPFRAENRRYQVPAQFVTLRQLCVPKRYVGVVYYVRIMYRRG